MILLFNTERCLDQYHCNLFFLLIIVCSVLSCVCICSCIYLPGTHIFLR